MKANEINRHLNHKSVCIYGGILVVSDGGKYYWAKEEDYFTPSFVEITKSLYDEAIRFNNMKDFVR